ncbi:MAG: hypothetical protein SNH16_06270 [Rikenellaceae bacterium]
MRKFNIIGAIFAVAFCLIAEGSVASALTSIDTHHTITKLALAKDGDKQRIIGVSYSGVALRADYDGQVKWEQNVSNGIMCYDLWCGDLTGDGRDEILMAIADGSVRCLDLNGKELWKFHPSPMPMISVCTIRDKKGDVYVACGGNDTNLYYLDAKGKLIKSVAASSYPSVLKPNLKWMGKEGLIENAHTINFLRPMPQEDGSDLLLMNGIISHADRNSVMFQFKPLAAKPHKSFKLSYGYGPIADMQLMDVNGEQLVVFGTTGARETLAACTYNPNTDAISKVEIAKIKGQKTPGGYRGVQTEIIPTAAGEAYFAKVGSQSFVIPFSHAKQGIKVLNSKFSFTDMCKDERGGKLIMGSAQSGGSAIHIFDLNDEGWMAAYEEIEPIGNIASILSSTDELHRQVEAFTAPEWQREPITIYDMDIPKQQNEIFTDIAENYPHVKLLGTCFITSAEDWDRKLVAGTPFETARDNRKKYTSTQDELVKKMTDSFTEDGAALWGGHGTDPFYFNPETINKVIAAADGKKTVWVWPELTILYKDDFQVAMDKLFYPLAESGSKNNAMLYIRSKHGFWLSKVYTPLWERFLDGDFADIFIPSMEETEDKSMDLSLAGRLGLWASGSCDQWGTRCARDNPSFVRNRQFCNQNLPNHFLRNSMFHISYGATYVNNFQVTSAYGDYLDIMWKMIAKGALFVPKREEIVSFSPVHLSVLEPAKEMIDEANSNTVTIRLTPELEAAKQPMVFDRMCGVWGAAAVTEWDFSRYAAGVKDRRLNFLAPYNNGVVLITPPQQGKFAKSGASRGKLVDNLHPIYKSILKEYYTDGVYYYSADGKKKYMADEYYKVIERDIEASAKLLPLTVSGDNVAWVAAESAPKHLRVSLFDGGYVNPAERRATIHFGTVTPVKIINVLTGEEYKFDPSSRTAELTIPCGMFLLLDITTDKKLI